MTSRPSNLIAKVDNILAWFGKYRKNQGARRLVKFAILGAGALGTILGAHLSRAGHEVAMIVRGDRARVLQRQGLVLNGLSDIKSRPTVIDDPKKLRETGTLIIATKAIDSAQSLETLRHLRPATMRSRCRTACSRTSCWRGFSASRACSAPWRISAASCSPMAR